MRNLFGHVADDMSTPRVAWHPSQRFVFSNSQLDGDVHVYGVASERVECRIAAHSKTVRALDASASGSLLVTCSFDKFVRVWDV